MDWKIGQGLILHWGFLIGLLIDWKLHGISGIVMHWQIGPGLADWAQNGIGLVMDFGVGGICRFLLDWQFIGGLIKDWQYKFGMDCRFECDWHWIGGRLVMIWSRIGILVEDRERFLGWHGIGSPRGWQNRAPLRHLGRTI